MTAPTEIRYTDYQGGIYAVMVKPRKDGSYAIIENNDRKLFGYRHIVYEAAHNLRATSAEARSVALIRLSKARDKTRATLDKIERDISTLIDYPSFPPA